MLSVIEIQNIIKSEILMSMPTISDINPDINLKREDVINMIAASITMEELALAHILNTEGEKLQYVLGTLEGSVPEK